MNLTTTAQTLRAATQDYLSAFRQYFAREVRPLPDERFWQLRSGFLVELLTFFFPYGPTNGIEQTARELLRKRLAEDFYGGSDGQPMPRYSLREAVQFAKTCGSSAVASPRRSSTWCRTAATTATTNCWTRCRWRDTR